MLLDELLETVNSEVAMAQQARDACHLFMDYVYKGNSPYKEVEFGRYGEMFAFRAEDVGIDKHVLVMIGLRQRDAIGLSGAVSSFSNPIFGYNRAIMIFGMTAFTEQELRRVATSTSFIEVFSHEYIHVLDADRSAGRMMKGVPGPENPKAYFNDPAEFNAFFHDVARPMFDLMKIAKTEPEHLDDMMGLYGFTGNWKDDLGHMLTKDRMTRRFVQTLTAARRRSLLKRLYRLYQMIVHTSHRRLANSPNTPRLGPVSLAHPAIVA